MVKKVWKNTKNRVMSALLPKVKRGGQAFGILAISTTPIWGDHGPPVWRSLGGGGGAGGHFHVMCPVTAGRNDNFGWQRPQTTNSISCTRLARSTAATCIAVIERTLNSMLIFCATTLERGVVKASEGRLKHLTRSGLAPEWPPW